MKNKVRSFTDEHQRQFVKLFEQASQRHNHWTVFSDFIRMAAISISNAVDKIHAEEREKDYLRTAKSYNKQELECFAHMLAEIVEGLDADQDQDFMGKLFMNLDLGNQYRGQFFTPYNVSRMMAQMTTSKEGLEAEIRNQGWIGVNDPACGAGGMLIAFANACLRYDINYQTSVLFVGQDVDYTAGCMCYLQMSLLGMPGYVVIANTITDPATCIDRRNLIPTPTQNVWYTPFYFLPEWHYRRIYARLDMLMGGATEASDSKPDRPNPPPELTEPVRSAPETETVRLNMTETKTGQLTLF